MLGLAPFLPLALPRPALPDSPAPLGLLRPGKPEPLPCGAKTKQKKITILHTQDMHTHIRTITTSLTNSNRIKFCVQFTLLHTKTFKLLSGQAVSAWIKSLPQSTLDGIQEGTAYPLDCTDCTWGRGGIVQFQKGTVCHFPRDVWINMSWLSKRKLKRGVKKPNHFYGKAK